MARKPNPLPGAGNDSSAKKRRASARNAGGGDDGNSGNGDGSSSAADRQHDRLTALLEQFGGGGFRLLAERIDGAGEPEYLGPVPFDSELYETVRQRWGGGRFGGRIVDERGKYKARIAPFRIGGPPRSYNAHEQSPASAAPSSLEATLQSINASLEALRRNPPAPAVDPVDQVTKIARALREAAGNQANAAPPDSIGMMRDMFGFMRELREESAPAAPENNFGVVLREGVQPLVQVLNRKLDIDAARETRRAGTPGAGPARVTAGAPPQQPASSNEESVIPSDELAALLLTIPRPARAFLLTCAQNEDEPEDYVPMLLNRLSEDAYEAMVRLLPREDFLEVLVSVVPAYAEHREWFGGLVDALRAAVAAATVEGDTGQATPAAQGVPA